MFSYEKKELIAIRIDDYLLFLNDLSRIKKIEEGIKIIYKSGGESIINSNDPDQLLTDVYHIIGGE
jgi:hypothetical protein